MSDMFKVLKNIQLLDRLKQVPEEVDDLKKRIKDLEDLKLSENKKLRCSVCGYSPIKITTENLQNGSKNITKICPKCNNEESSHISEKTSKKSPIKYNDTSWMT